MVAEKGCVVKDVNVAKLPSMGTVLEALEREGVNFEVFDKVMVEPKDYS